MHTLILHSLTGQASTKADHPTPSVVVALHGVGSRKVTTVMKKALRETQTLRTRWL